MAEGSALEWSMGFRNKSSGKYLTQETFGYALNSQSANMKKKQIFNLLPAEGGVYIKTHLGKFLYGQVDGTFKGDADNVNADCVWSIEPQLDGTWALKSKHGFYANSNTKGDVSAFAKELPKDHSGEWVVHLAMHPQINLYNVMRKRYVQFKDGELQASEDVPWGEQALLTFVFFNEHPSGRYGLMAYNGQFLTANGKMSPVPNADSQFLLGFHDDCISLRDEQGNYLSCLGAAGSIKAAKSKITKDELFKISDSEPQFNIKASSGKQVSIKTSVELKADQTAVTGKELFQLEVDPSGSGKVALKSSNGNYLTVVADGTVTATAKAKGPSEYITIEYHGSKVKFIFANGKYVTVKPNGGLVANGNGADATSLFTFTLINRPEIVLRGQFGFVGVKGASGRLEVNKSVGETFLLKSDDGNYFFSYQKDGKHWNVDADGVAATSAAPVVFHLEFVERSKFLIKHADSGKYLEGEQAGGFRATGSGANANTLWEY